MKILKIALLIVGIAAVALLGLFAAGRIWLHQQINHPKLLISVSSSVGPLTDLEVGESPARLVHEAESAVASDLFHPKIYLYEARVEPGLVPISFTLDGQPMSFSFHGRRGARDEFHLGDYFVRIAPRLRQYEEPWVEPISSLPLKTDSTPFVDERFRIEIEKETTEALILSAQRGEKTQLSSGENE